MHFAALVIERPPLEWSGFVGALGRWLQDVGIYAFIWLLLVGLSYAAVREFRQRSPWGGLHTIMAGLGGIAAVLYIVFLFLLATQEPPPNTKTLRSFEVKTEAALATKAYTPSQGLFFSLAGLAALTACVAPIFRDLGQRRIVPRRIWAIARVSIKEAWSRGIVWVCLIIPAIYLFADWHLTMKPEDQLRSRVGIAYYSMATLFVLSAALLGAFSISADLKNQNMFTIVTKPVERFEIVLGRFLGYAVLLFGELLVLTVISYIYVVRGLSDQAVEESYHARVPLLGSELFFFNTGPSPGRYFEGENVGRVWGYRTHITGKDPQEGRNRVQYAVWAFDELPAALLDRADEDDVHLEFSFDIFRTSVGQENKGVYCSFTIARGDISVEEIETLFDRGVFAKEFNALFAQGRDRKEILETILEKRGVFQIPSVSVTDYHTQTVEIPAKVFKALHKSAQGRTHARTSDKSPVLQILVNVEDSSRFQRVGMAKADLYILVEDRPFSVNFFKGALCIYLISCVVLALAIAASTYLTGIVSLLMTALLCLGGVFLPFIRSLVSGQLETYGPGESLFRLANRQTATLPMDQQSAMVGVINVFDAGFRGWMRFTMSVLPDLEVLYPKDYVANGYDITWGTLMLLNFIVPVAAYVLPWAILSYYLMKSREIANP